MTGLTGGALKLYRAILAHSSEPDVQLALVLTLARRHAASSKDVAAVRAFLQRDRERAG